MASTTYSITVKGEVRAQFVADLTRASEPIYILHDHGVSHNRESTPFQTSDARHREREAARLIIGYCASEGGPCVEDGEEWDVHEEVA